MAESIKSVRLPVLPHDSADAPPAADSLPSRRGFLRGLAASMALAGMYGCSKRPKETIVPYVSQPEQMVPGEPMFFATTLTHAGYGRGVIVTSREGRPIKIEGNPDHPASLGAADAFMQAAVLDLYDPARSKTVTRGGEPNAWGGFVEALRASLPNVAAGEVPKGLRILTEPVTSPTVLRQLQHIDRVFTGGDGFLWRTWEPIDRDNAATGLSSIFQGANASVYHLEKAEVIVSAGSDFLTDEPGSLVYARHFANGRRPAPDKPAMNRLYVAESTFSITGSRADHRIAVRPSEVGAFVFALAAQLKIGTGSIEFGDKAWLDAVSADLLAHAGRSLLVVGAAQPPEVHAAAARINLYLGNYGKTIDAISSPATSASSIDVLIDEMAAGQVSTLLILGGNPARTAGQRFASELATLSSALDAHGRPRNFTAHLGLYADETAFNCQWHVPAAHELESWGDARAHDGTASIIQPLLAPLYEGHGIIDVLSELQAADSRVPRSAYEIVRETHRDKDWPAILQRGVVDGTAFPPVGSALTDRLPRGAMQPNDGPPKQILRSSDNNQVDVIFAPDASAYDGRYFHNAWLQELPRPLTKIVWGNAALISPATAQRFALADGDIVELSAGDRSIEIPVLALPGHAHGVVTLHLGYGRHQLVTQPTNTSGGPGDTFGVDVYPLRAAASPYVLSDVALKKTWRSEKIIRTHNHHAMASQKGSDTSVAAMLTPVIIATPDMAEADLKLHNRKLIRTGTLDQYAKTPDFAQAMEEKKTLSLYTPWDYSSSPQWGMTIDLSTCIGCNACTIACQAENNIPVVGPEGVDREREMHWIRIDSYFGEGPIKNSTAVYHQPVPCMHCENAPCEYVCPVAATSHSTDGLNQMTYNRCVGTRYCSNNCPYKVRRFNFFNYTADTTATVALQHNPDVTVRTLGVMEKCTYCVQRIEYTKRKSEIAAVDARLKEGEDAAKEVTRKMIDRLQTACQQSCPSQAITFGNIADSGSAVSATKKNPRNYGLLTELTTKPRTTYLAHISNPNPALAGGNS